MSNKHNRRFRRATALERLNHQINTGKKKAKDGNLIDLNVKDIKRINREVGILEQRIKDS